MKLSTKYDLNGNRILRLKSCYGGFSVQTNGNINICMWGIDQTDINAIQAVFNSLAKYVRSFGTARQKQIISSLQTESTAINHLFERDLTETEGNHIIGILSKHCHYTTYKRITSLITYSFNACKPYLSRFMVYSNTGRVSYCAGQSYPDEIRYIRESLLKQFP